jgi:membrane associated rhomboid family serine protease
MFLPLTSDASLKHWPIATVSLICVHVAFLIAQFSMPSQIGYVETGVHDSDGSAEVRVAEIPGWYHWMLSHGDGLHPVQWFTSMMIHDGVGHLIGNMIFLWVFGHVVEGIIGGFSFAALYLGMGISQNILEQLLLLGTPGMPSLGASSAIFAIMMVAVLWAPQDNIQSLLIIFYQTMIIPIPILIMGAFYFLWDFGLAALQGFSVGTQLFHVSGAVIGLTVGFAILFFGKLDCDERDILSMIRDSANRPGRKKMSVSAQAASSAPTPVEAAEQKRRLSNAWKMFDSCLEAGNIDTALAQLHVVRRLDRDVIWDEQRLLHLIQVLLKSKRHDDALKFAEAYLAQFTSRADPVRLHVARINAVEKELPRKALKILDAIDISKLDVNQHKVAANLRAHCNKAISDGNLEVSED